MKYFDGMGNEVTSYVEALVKKAEKTELLEKELETLKLEKQNSKKELKKSTKQ